jgi:hypothetical protein
MGGNVAKDDISAGPLFFNTDDKGREWYNLDRIISIKFDQDGKTVELKFEGSEVQRITSQELFDQLRDWMNSRRFPR